MILNNSEHTYIKVDGDGIISSINNPNQLIVSYRGGLPWSDYFIENFRPDPSGLFYSLPNGNYVNISIFSEEDGQIILINDISKIIDLNIATSKHHRLNAMMEMSGSISHQIKTPLANALLQSELLLDDLNEDRIYKIINSITNINTLLNEIFIFSKSKSDGVGLLRSRSIIASLSSDFIGTTSINSSGDDVSFIGNETLIVSALSNLVQNSIDARADSTISIHTSTINGVALFSYTDTSGGFSNSNKSTNGGWGIGMSVTKFIIEAHGGSINYRNTDNGVNINITIPIENSIS